jgi:TolA-binding protein
MESLVASRDETIARLEGQVQEMTTRIREMKKSHKMELQEAHVRMQQEIYLAKHFREEEGKSSKRLGLGRASASSRGRTKPKLKNS